MAVCMTVSFTPDTITGRARVSGATVTNVRITHSHYTSSHVIHNDMFQCCCGFNTNFCVLRPGGLVALSSCARIVDIVFRVQMWATGTSQKCMAWVPILGRMASSTPAHLNITSVKSTARKPGPYARVSASIAVCVCVATVVDMKGGASLTLEIKFSMYVYVGWLCVYWRVQR